MTRTAWTVSPDDAGARLDKWLANPQRLGSRGQATTALERRKVFVDDVEQTIGDAARRLVAGERVRVWADRPGSSRARGPRTVDGLSILFEDDALIVVAKPAGMLTVRLASEPGAESLAERLQHHWRSHAGREPHAVHRIDRDTSGLVVFAANGAAWHALRSQFARREPERVYLAVVHDVPSPARGTWRDWIRWNAESLRQQPARPGEAHAREAVLDYRVRAKSAGVGCELALVEVRLHSGRQHQIRAQAELHGHPLVGERMYRGAAKAGAIEFPRQALHAWKLAFDHPVTGRRVEFEAPLPEDLRALLSRLGIRFNPRGEAGARGTP